MTRRFGFVAGFYRANGFDAYICQGEIAIKKGRVGSIILLDSAHELGLECERGRRSDVTGVLTAEGHELIVEGCQQF